VADPTPEQEDMLSHLYLVFFGRPLSLCGCGDPEAGVRLVYDLLKLHDQPGLIYDTVGAVLGDNQGVQQVVLSVLESAELTEHGTSLWGMLLTSRGKWVLWAAARLEAAGVDWAAGPSEQTGYPDHDCTEECWKIPKAAQR
jgi:hypothetical protein